MALVIHVQVLPGLAAGSHLATWDASTEAWHVRDSGHRIGPWSLASAVRLADTVIGPRARMFDREVNAMDDVCSWSSGRAPETYDQLVNGLRREAAEPDCHPNYMTRHGELSRVFDWCRHQGLDLAYLEVEKHHAKYWAASAFLKGPTSNDEPEDA